MADNNTTSWVDGHWFVPLKKTRSCQRNICRSLYEATFGDPLLNGVADSSLPRQEIEILHEEQDLEVLLIDNTDTDRSTMH